MPPSPTHLLAAIDGTDATSYVTASFSITANRLVLVGVTSFESGGASAAPTLSGLTATWSQIATVADTANARRVSVFCTMVSSNETGSLTIDFAAVTQETVTWMIQEWAGADTSGCGNAVVQSATNTTESGTSLAVTLAAYASAENRPVAFYRRSDSQDLAPESGWTELFDVTTGTESMNHTSIWRDNTDDTTPSVSWTGLELAQGIALEIKAAGHPQMRRWGGIPHMTHHQPALVTAWRP